jgi:hypothetical protein
MKILKKIPTVVIHRGDKSYLKYNLEISSKTNEIVLIGDTELSKYSKLYKNVHFVDIKKYEIDESIVANKKFFKNYSSNDAEFEWRCFERVFIIQKFMEEYKFSKVFHIDSDAVLLVDINELKYEKDCGYLTPSMQDNFRMDSSIHFGLLDTNFCTQFHKLYEDIYVSGNKFNLIQDKISFHKFHDLKGGICDMTLYYLLKEENYLEPQNFMKEVKDLNKEDFIFINNINKGEGFYDIDNFKMKGKFIKILNNSIEDSIQNKKIKIAGIHFQGVAKKQLNWFLKYKLR